MYDFQAASFWQSGPLVLPASAVQLSVSSPRRVRVRVTDLALGGPVVAFRPRLTLNLDRLIRTQDYRVLKLYL